MWSASNDGIGIWNAIASTHSNSSKQKTETLKEHAHRVTCLAKFVTSEDIFVFSGGFDSSICIWSSKQRALVDKLTHHTQTVRSFLHVREDILWTAGDDQVVFETKLKVN